MRLQPRTKKTIAILVVVALIAIGGLTAVVVSLVRSAPPSLPTVTAYAQGRAVTVEPGLCSADGTCAGLEAVMLEVPAGRPLQLSLPSEIAESDWRLNVTYGDPRTGEIFEGFRDYTPGQARAVTVPSDPGAQLLNVVLELPATGEQAPVWAIQTF